MEKETRDNQKQKKTINFSDESSTAISYSSSEDENVMDMHKEISEIDLELEQLIKLSEILLNLFQNNKNLDQSKDNPINIENDLLLKILEEDDLDKIDYNKYKLTKINNQPSKLKLKLNQYQLEGLNWMLNLCETGFNGILADEMGLGKTIQTIALITYLKEYKNKSKFLIVAPKSVIPNWIKEFKTWTGDFLNVVFLNAVKGEREELLEKFVISKKFEVLLTTYEGVSKCLEELSVIKFDAMIADEGHKLKSEKTLTTQSMKEINATFKVLLTGTPLQNNLSELWTLFNFILPDLFNSASQFKKWFSIEKEGEVEEQEAFEIIKTLHKVLKPFLLRRTKADVEKVLPSKKEILLKFHLSKEQDNLYRNIAEKGLREISDKKIVYKNIIMQLRKVCNHPYLFEDFEQEDDSMENLVTCCSKMSILDKLLKRLKEQNSRVLIFSQMTRVLDILEDYCNYRNFQFCRLDGKTSLINREQQISEFSDKNSNKFIFLLSTRAGGVGLNLCAADTVVLYDSDWNPQMDLQAMDRAHRIGQTKNVLVYRLLCANTVEEKILETQAIKLRLDSLVIQKNKKNDTFKIQEMRAFIQYGLEKVFEEGEDFKDEDIETILERGEKNTEIFNNKTEKTAMNLANLKGGKNIKSYQFLNEKESDSQEPFQIPFYHFIENKEKVIEIKLKQKDYFIKKRYYLPKNFHKNLNIYEGLKKEEYTLLVESLENSFQNWTLNEFNKFFVYLEKFGSHDLVRIADHVNSKSFKEVLEYSKVFFDKIHELPETYAVRLNKIKEKNDKIIKNVLNFYNFSYENIQIDYNPKRKTTFEDQDFSEQDDKYLIYQTYSNGYGNWEKINLKLKEEMHSYFLSSRESYEIRMRVDYLISLLEKKEFSNEKIKSSFDTLNLSIQKNKKRGVSYDSQSSNGKTVKLINYNHI